MRKTKKKKKTMASMETVDLSTTQFKSRFNGPEFAGTGRKRPSPLIYSQSSIRT